MIEKKAEKGHGRIIKWAKLPKFIVKIIFEHQEQIL